MSLTEPQKTRGLAVAATETPEDELLVSEMQDSTTERLERAPLHAHTQTTGDFVTVLVSRGKNFAKTWKQDGSVAPYDDALWVQVEERQVANFQELCCLLAAIENDPHRCVIRGRLRSDWRAILTANLPKWNEERQRMGKPALQQPGQDWTLRRLALFEDVPHHWMMCDVDGFAVPLGADHTAAISLYLAAMPAEFRDTSYRWQMSNSAGRPEHAGKLKAHLWFWSDKQYSSTELKAWAQEINAPQLPGSKPLVDSALFQCVQIHYTAAPVFEPGVADPIPLRSGVEDLSFLNGDEVTLHITDGARLKASAPTKSKEDLVDPRDKPSLIGAFHRAITIEDAIERFLPQEFEWVTNTRLTWVGGGGAPQGVFVREDRQGLGASHNTWPWGANRTANTFDLVRHFRFGYLDVAEDGFDEALFDANPANRPSHEAMIELVKGLPKVIAEMARAESKQVPAPPSLSKEELQALTLPGNGAPAALPAPYPGTMADVVAAALAAAPKPQPELATLAALIGMASCCAGYYYLPGGARLNLYGAGVAGTGAGKDLPRNVAVELAKAGGARLIGKPASGQGLEDTLEPYTGILSEVDEIAHLMAAINGSNSPSYLIELAGNILRLFSASSGTYTTRVRATAKGVAPSKAIPHPCVSLIGFATPEKLGEAVGTGNIEDGLLGRLLFAFGRPNVEPRRTSMKFGLPDSVAAAANAMRMAANAFAFDDQAEPGIQIGVEAEADSHLDELLRAFDQKANAAGTPFARALLVRSFEKCERVAGVLAVWENPAQPIMTISHVAWAEQLIAASDSAALHFCGEYMHGGQVQADAALVLRTLRRVLNGEFRSQRANELAHIKAGLAPHSAILRASKLEKRRFDAAIEHLIDLAEIRREHTESTQANGRKTPTCIFSLVQPDA